MSSATSGVNTTSTGLHIQSGHACEQGIRPTMEDEVLLKESFHIPGRGHFSMFGVFDGHGGRAAAIFTRDHLFELVVAELQSGQEPSQALTRAYLNTDKRFIAACRGVNEAESNQSTQTPTMPSTPTLPNAAPQRRQQSANLAVKIPVSLPVAATNSRSTSAASGAEILEKDTSGTTAVCVLLHHETYQLYVGNVGDSRAVLSCSNGSVIALTNDHKADRPDEVDRIRRAGGFVVHKRVMGELAISRAIGDLDFKETGFLFVLADPELCTRQLTAGDDFILLACDGIFDVMSNEQACIFVRESLQAGKSVQSTSENMVRHAIETLNTRDNVTAILIKLPSPSELKSAGIHPPSVDVATDSSTQLAQLRDSHVTTPSLTPHTPATQTLFATPQLHLEQQAQTQQTHAGIATPQPNQPLQSPHPPQPSLSPSIPIQLPSHPSDRLPSSSRPSSTEVSDAHIEFHDGDDHDMDTTAVGAAGTEEDAKTNNEAEMTQQRKASDEKTNRANMATETR